ncbi:hypothetical protein BD309DRAFT_954483 [Dichomitus squalens]|uniref:Uncharacterized protein n=2 Tax=Dichomitus squalens TaxID=114155 RepID=A0A4V2K4X7_9APHY|nr:uncharacterized protein DICSQDRAFT_180998 [Dichomitus squalens LYAD-421 SS1]EJF61023.1 hypothetical protein DICSQDRAFT_180998 [Dichomitus squalens LYAD-421 SS1]TBU46233.1 hypothetical protein BD309DRAFT_954483 [Dichomitus squalens]TBU57366.1 hypothetical protein BD310DRAFT_557630 [Dichomitus squalens]
MPCSSPLEPAWSQPLVHGLPLTNLAQHRHLLAGRLESAEIVATRFNSIKVPAPGLRWLTALRHISTQSIKERPCRSRRLHLSRRHPSTSTIHATAYHHDRSASSCTHAHFLLLRRCARGAPTALFPARPKPVSRRKRPRDGDWGQPFGAP